MTFFSCTLTVKGNERSSGIYFGGKWAQSCWSRQWFEDGLFDLILHFLEIFPVVVALSIWSSGLKNQKIEAAVTIITKRSSKSKKCGVPSDKACFLTPQFYILLEGVHISGKLNNLADSLSVIFSGFTSMSHSADRNTKLSFANLDTEVNILAGRSMTCIGRGLL